MHVANGGSGFEEADGESFSNAFVRPLKFAWLSDDLKSRKEYVFNRDIPRWSCLCELCVNVTLLTTGVYKVLKDKLPTSPHDTVQKFSCSSTRHCIYDGCCKIFYLLLISIFQTIWKYEILTMEKNINKCWTETMGTLLRQMRGSLSSKKMKTLHWNLTSFCIKWRFCVVLWSVWKRLQTVWSKYLVLNNKTCTTFSRLWCLKFHSSTLLVLLTMSLKELIWK